MLVRVEIVARYIDHDKPMARKSESEHQEWLNE